MLDLYGPEEEEMLELLVPVLLDEDVAPPEEGLRALREALDAKFGAELASDPDDEAAVVPLRRGLTRVVTGVAAAIVVLALGLAWYGWHEASAPSPARTKLEDATAALRTDLRNGSPHTRIERDVTGLAAAMSTLPMSERTDMTAAPNQLIAAACRWLEGSASGSRTPSTSLPQICHLDGVPQTANTSSSGAQRGFTADQGPRDQRSRPNGEGPAGSPSHAGMPDGTTTPSLVNGDRPPPDQYGTPAAQTPTPTPTQAQWPSGTTQPPPPQGAGTPSAQSTPDTGQESAHTVPTSPSTVPTTTCSPNASGGGSNAFSSGEFSSGSSVGTPHRQP
jgi:hypothetical protein